MSDDILTRNENEELAVRVVSTTGDTGTNPNDVYTRDDNGKLCVRVTGAGGGDQHNLGYYATLSDLQTAHPTAEAGDWAIVGATDTVWIWDDDNSEWVDSDQKGQVTSVNGQTGDVVLSIPAAQVNSDWDADSGVAQILNKPTLGTAAAANTTDFATASQGAKADTAVQPEDLATVATTGNYNDLSNKPVIPQAGVPQYTTMPTPSASNVGEVAQYSGETIPDVPASATITQTVGSGLTDLVVNVDTFIETEQPTGDETVDFVANVVPNTTNWTVGVGSFSVSGDLTSILEHHDWGNEMSGVLVFEGQDDCYLGPSVGINWFTTSRSELSSFGIVVTGDTANQDYAEFSRTLGTTTWEKDSEPVTLANYGISYSGNAVDGDTLEIDYSALVPGKTKGYFYLNTPTYSEPTATISQTTGSGLTDLAVDVDTFVATEQPTQSENVVFECQKGQENIGFITVESTGTIEGTASEFVDFMRTEYGFWDAEKYSGTITIYPNNSVEVGPQSGGVWFTTYVATLETYGLVVTNLSAVDASKINYDYTPAEVIWYKNGDSVDLSAYGVTYIGTPNDNDELTVVYTAPTITGYNWNQINVQPAGEGGGSGGIEWKTIVDLPVGATSNWRISALYRVAGGLPYGNYEVYWQVKDLAPYGVSYTPYAVATWLIRFSVSENEVRGYMSPVIDGDFGGNSDKKLPTESNTIWSGLFYKDGDDFIIVARDSNYLATLIPGYGPATDVPECFKLSAIVNVDTGQKYIATGIIDDGGSYTGLSTSMYILPIQNTPPQRDYLFSSNNIELSNSTDGISISNISISTGSGIETTERLDIILESPLGKYSASFKGLISDYEFIVYEATGVFENAQLGYSNYGAFGLKFNLPNNTNTTFSWRVAYYGCRDNPSAYLTTGLATFKATFVPLKPGSTIRTSIIGKILQYTGVTDANYTNGYFYKANGTIISVPENATFTTSDSDVAVSITLNDFVTAIRNIWGWTADDVKNMLNSNSYWQMDYDVDNSAITRLYWGATGDLQGYPDVMSAISVTYTGSQTGIISNIDMTSSYTPAHQEVQNPSWDRVDVQPLNLTSITGYDATKTQVLKNVQGVMTWVDE